MASGDAGSGQHGSGESSGDKQRQSSVPSHNALQQSNGGSGSGGGNTGPRSGAGSNPQVRSSLQRHAPGRRLRAAVPCRAVPSLLLHLAPCSGCFP